MHQIGTGSASLPARASWAPCDGVTLGEGTQTPGMCQLAGWGCARVPAGIPGPGWHPGRRAAGLAIRHVGPGQASPAAAPRCASLAGTQGPAPAAKARRFPSPGEELGKDPVAQVRQRAHAPGDPPASPSAKD